jgi:hypothetical protein
MYYHAAALVAVLCIVIVWLVGAGQSRRHHLSNRGWMLYLLQGCSACDRQLDILGAGGYSPARICGGSDDEQHRCPQAFPAWANLLTGETRTGVQDDAALNEMSGRATLRR